MASFALLVGATALQVTQDLKAGDEAKRSFDKAGQEEIRQAGVAQREILDQQREVAIEGELATGATEATAAGRGLRIGGSVTGQVESISRNMARRQRILSQRASDIGVTAEIAAKEFKRRGKRAKKASRLRAYGSLLTLGAAGAKQVIGAGGFARLLGKG